MKTIGLFTSVCLIVFSCVHAWAVAPDFKVPAIDRDAADIFIPKSSGPHPVILLLHGLGGGATQIEDFLGLVEPARKAGYIVIVPNGQMGALGFRYWNASPACCDFFHTGIDDVGYLTELLKTVQQTWNGDVARTYIVGHSNGAFMAHRMACERADLIEKIVSFAGAMQSNTSACKPSRPVDILQIHAVDDDTIAFSGDPSGYTGLEGYSSVAATLRQWVSINHCSSKSRAAGTLDLIKEIPGPDTDVDVYDHCCSGVEVSLWKIRAHSDFGYSGHMPTLTRAFAEDVLNHLNAPKSPSAK